MDKKAMLRRYEEIEAQLNKLWDYDRPISHQEAQQIHELEEEAEELEKELEKGEN